MIGGIDVLPEYSSLEGSVCIVLCWYQNEVLLVILEAGRNKLKYTAWVKILPTACIAEVLLCIWM